MNMVRTSNNVVKVSIAIACLLVIATSAMQPEQHSVVKRRKSRCGSLTRYNNLFTADSTFRTLRQKILGFTQAYETLSASSRVKTRTELIRIPVVVHVIYTNDTNNISDAQIASQIVVLNNDYQNLTQSQSAIPTQFRNVIGNPRLKFEMATFGPDKKPTNGIVRSKTTTTVFYSSGLNVDKIKARLTGGDDPWPADKYLNIWIAPSLRDEKNQEIAGYSSFPGDPPSKDGVAIVNDSFGTMGTAQAPYNGGRSATHEIGHWLNLFHLWGVSDTGFAQCSGSDQVDDTPLQAQPNTGCPTYPHLSCNNANSGGDMFMDYMDYSDDSCMRMFTAGQVLRMESTLTIYRAAIQNSPGLAH
jgi:hypothetical protein